MLRITPTLFCLVFPMHCELLKEHVMHNFEVTLHPTVPLVDSSYIRKCFLMERFAFFKYIV